MDHTKKMAVVPQDLLEILQYNQKQKLGSTGQFVMNLDKTMQAILLRDDLPEDEKLLLYSDAVSNYMKAKNLTKQPTLTSPTTTTAVVNHAVKKIPNWSEKVRQQLPQNTAKKGVQVLDWINEHIPDLKWSDKGELEDVPQSNILDLIDEVTRAKSRSNRNKPKGIDKFVKKLHEGNIPHQLIGNQLYLTPEEEDIPEDLNTAAFPPSPPKTPRRPNRAKSAPGLPRWSTKFN